MLLAVGDLHVENFGVWKNSLGDQVWGVNDFDDACELPFTSDLVRLAASIGLAAKQQQVKASAGTVCSWVLAGYRSGLNGKGRPFMVSEHEPLRVLTERYRRRCGQVLEEEAGVVDGRSTATICRRDSSRCSKRRFHAAPR